MRGSSVEKIRELDLRIIVKYGIFIVIGGFIAALFLYGILGPKEISNPHTASAPWNNHMVLGNVDAKNKMVEYTDYFCSFCAQLHDAMTDEFKKQYIDSGKLSFETRIVALLKDTSANTEKGNEAAFCAADQNKYWEYSNKIIPAIERDYFSKGIGVKNVANPVKIPKLPDEYFINLARDVGMNADTFSDCIKNDTYAAEIEKNTNRALEMGVSGLPNIIINNYTASGFGGGGYKELKLMLESGGVK